MGGLIKNLLGPLIQAFSSGSCFQWRATGGRAICQVVIDRRLKIGPEFFHGLPLEGNTIRDSYNFPHKNIIPLAQQVLCRQGRNQGRSRSISPPPNEEFQGAGIFAAHAPEVNQSHIFRRIYGPVRLWHR